MSDDEKSYETCGATANSTGEPCQRPAGWGTRNDSGPCKFHGGCGGDVGDPGGAPEGNSNGVKHDMFSSSNGYYQRRDEVQQKIITEIFDQYCDRFEQRHGEPTTGDSAMLFKVAVSIHKMLKADSWEVDRPAETDSGHPLVDRSERRTEHGERVVEYSPTVVLQAERQLQGFVRKWLKDNELLAPSEEGADVEVEVTGQMWDNLTEYYDD